MSATDRVASLLGIVPGERQSAAEQLYLVTRDPMVYWLQLIIAAGIAHFGLVLNSTAVVIGGMLVSPLMTPIVQLGMSFAVGNFFLAAKAALRIVISVLVVVTLAALMTKLMPFAEVTPEILARVQPTALDLIVALFCGLAAAFTAAASSKDSVSAAAGTAIAIALVPPLCVVGFGLGIGSAQIFWGALLLFTANLSAIILVSDLFFLLTGFGDIDSSSLDETVLSEQDKDSLPYRTAKRFKMNPSRPSWLTFRVLLPLAFVATVLFPLTEALGRVAWEVNVKKGVNSILSRFEEEHRVLHKVQSVNFGAVSVYLTIVGEPGSRNDIMRELQLKLATVSGVEPTVGLDIIPSSEFMSASLKQSTEQLSKQLASLKLEQSARPQQTERLCPSAEDAAGGLPPVFFQNRLRGELGQTLGWLGKDDPDGEWLDWSLGISPGGSTLTLHRISDQDLSQGHLTLAASVLLKETGIHAGVEEQRIPRTLFDTTAANAARIPRDEIRSRLAQIKAASNNRVQVRLGLRNPDAAPNPREKLNWTRMNEALRETAQDIPEARVKVADGQERWYLHLGLVPPSAPVAPTDQPAQAPPEPPVQPESDPAAKSEKGTPAKAEPKGAIVTPPEDKREPAQPEEPKTGEALPPTPGGDQPQPG